MAASIEGGATTARPGLVTLRSALLHRVPWALDGAVALMAFGATVAVFASGSGRLGFYSDDSGFLISLPHEGFRATIQAAQDYVPGRNLHIIWQRLLFLVGGYRPGDLGTLHVLQSVLDGITVVLFFALLRSLRLPRVWAVLGTAVFAFYPNHGETHFWLSAGPMNVMSTLFFLAFAVTAVHAMRSVSRTHAPDGRLLTLEFVLFGLAMFTYDQTFFCLLLVVAVQIGQMAKGRVRPSVTAVAAGVAALVLAAVDIHLKQNPASGPTLAHASLGHILSNMKLSFSLTWGSIFTSQLHALAGSASHRDTAMALACAVGLFALATALIARSLVGRRKERDLPPTGADLLRYTGCCLAGVLAFLLGYLPADAWSISPRHNFLPTVGFALALSSAAAALSSFIQANLRSYASSVFALICAAVAAYAVFLFVQAGLAEKGYWAAAYQPRLTLYRHLLDRHLLAGKSAIVFQNFPASVGPAPFFAQENANALLYLYPGRLTLTASAISALEAQRGYYLDNEIDRYGIADRYFPAHAVLDVVYRSKQADEIKYTLGDARYKTSRFYDVRRTARPGSTAASRSEPIQGASIGVRRGKLVLTLQLDLRGVNVAGQENLGLLLSHRAGTEEALTSKNPYGERMLVPIGLVDGPMRGTGKVGFDVVLKDPVFRSANAVSLYVFGSDPPRLLQTAPIAP